MKNSIFDRWDLTIDVDGDPYPSWLEVTPSGGQFVGRVGSARPLAGCHVSDDTVTFSLPRQYEARSGDLKFNGSLIGDALVGETTLDDGKSVIWRGVRAPALPQREVPWDEAIELIGLDLSGWVPREAGVASNWHITDGMLVNSAVGTDLVTKSKFSDFRLIAEYRYPAESNSGIYLRGRYEFQIVDDFTSGAHGTGSSAAIYGFLAPTENAIRPPEEWNVAEITLIGRYVSVTLNGRVVIDGAEIPGITGGALDSDEATPGPFFVQGDHGPVTFRRLTLYRAIDA